MPPKGTKVGPPAVDAAASGSSPAAQQQRAHSAGIAEFELPKTTLTKLAKGSIPDNVKMQQDVVLALHRSSTLFINYLTAASHDQALARSGKQITASDVIKAITELDFGPADNLVPLLEVELAAYRRINQTAKAQKQAAKGAGPGRGARRKSQAGTDVEMLDGDDADPLAGGYDESADGLAVGDMSGFAGGEEIEIPSGGPESDLS